MKIKIYEYSEDQLWYMTWETLETESIIDTVEITNEEFEEIQKCTLKELDRILLEKLIDFTLKPFKKANGRVSL